MPKTVRSRSPGARLCLTAALVLAGLGPTKADDLADGHAAFGARDYLSAAQFWRAAAAAGSAEAGLQLGLMADLGLGMPQDPVAAFGHYLLAAKRGQAEAAFNVGVMLDAGTGVRRDRIAAVVWYARAALGGNPRAAFNLGILYRDGHDMPANPQVAAHWLGIAAATLPAAKAALDRLDPVSGEGELRAPVTLATEALDLHGQAFADLIWTAEPGPQGSSLVVQVLAGTSLWTQKMTGSALRIPLPRDAAVWRVARVSGASGQYRASPWQHLPGPLSRTVPRAMVTLATTAGDACAAATADAFAAALQSGSLAIRVATSADPAVSSTIRYRYLGDADLAQDVAAFLPGFANVTPARTDDPAVGPGEVVVSLVLSPAPADLQDRCPVFPQPEWE